jgi:hypothetical protein
MVKNGDAHLLSELIYPESEFMRGTLKRLSILLGHVEELARAIQKRFPEEVSKFREEARKAAEEGETPPLLEALTGQGRLGEGDKGRRQEQAIREIVARLFADPYGWIEQNEGRLSTLPVTDDTATVTLDGRPVAGVGIPLRLDQGKWYVVLPTNFSGAARVLPKAPQQWKMVNSLIKILDNTVVELIDDVRAGRLKNLKAIGDKAQEKILFPAGIWFAAYSADLDARRRVDRAVRLYRERQKAWVKSRTQSPPPGIAPGVSKNLAKAMETIAATEIETLARARTWREASVLGDRDFEEMVEAWLVKNGVDVRLNGVLVGDEVESEVAEWEAAGKNK